MENVGYDIEIAFKKSSKYVQVRSSIVILLTFQGLLGEPTDRDFIRPLNPTLCVCLTMASRTSPPIRSVQKREFLRGSSAFRRYDHRVQ